MALCWIFFVLGSGFCKCQTRLCRHKGCNSAREETIAYSVFPFCFCLACFLSAPVCFVIAFRPAGEAVPLQEPRSCRKQECVAEGRHMFLVAFGWHFLVSGSLLGSRARAILVRELRLCRQAMMDDDRRCFGSSNDYGRPYSHGKRSLSYQTVNLFPKRRQDLYQMNVEPSVFSYRALFCKRMSSSQ